MNSSYRLFVKRDLDGFFGLFVDNLVQLLLIVTLCRSACGMSEEHSYLVFRYILPGAAVSILLGNVFYSWQAQRLARRSGRSDVTALPYGINTPSLLVYVYFVMQPAYERTGDPLVAWQMGLLACMGSGLIEFFGSFVAESLRRNTPRAALLATLAGISIGFISMTFALRIWQYPLVAMLPMAFVLVSYFAKIQFPLGLPGGFLAILAGTVLGWMLPEGSTQSPLTAEAVRQGWEQTQGVLPHWAGGALVEAVRSYSQDLLGLLSVIIPMGLFNVVGSLQNIESAEAAGDRFRTGPSLAVNGLGTMAAALFGSCFPTTIYIGHPGWKSLGARSGYSVLNGIVITVLCFTGTVALVSSVVPIEAGIAIVLWIGVIITAQAYQATPTEHAPAVALGLFPAIAAWGATVVAGAFNSAGGRTMQAVLGDNPGSDVNGFLLHGLHLLESGFIFTSMILAAASVCLIDHKFFAAAWWALVAAGLTGLGLMHAYQITGNFVDYYFPFSDAPSGGIGYHASGIAAGYVLMALLFALLGVVRRRARNK